MRGNSFGFTFYPLVISLPSECVWVENVCQSRVWCFSLIHSYPLPSAFYESLIQILTPLSREGIRAGYKKEIPLPGLTTLILKEDYSSAVTEIDARDLVELMASRRACLKGRSCVDVSAIANGQPELLEAAPSGGEPAFGDQSCSELIHLQSDVPVKADATTSNWLKRNFQGLHVEKWV